MAITYDSVKPWGRRFSEYVGMFALAPQDLQGRILGCGDGPASFNAEATAMGHQIISVDPIYSLSAAQIEQRIHETRFGSYAAGVAAGMTLLRHFRRIRGGD
jgi:hypothetical protein